MNFETVKTYILYILVGISLILTFSLWNYQPIDDPLDNNEPLLDENEFSLGGKEHSKKELITPSNIIFEKNNYYYGFKDPLDTQSLYREMQSWNLNDIRETEANGRPNDNNLVEIKYPLPLPVSILPSLFSVDIEEERLPEWSFQQVYITFESNQMLTIQFISIDGRDQVKFNVTNAEKYDLLWDYLVNFNGLVEYMVFEDSENPIYIPYNEVTLARQKLGFDTVDPLLLVNALFTSPDEVVKNPSRDNGDYYQDGVRTMRVSQDEISMEYTNPQQSSYDPVTADQLIDKSITRINEFKGWINNFQVDSIDTLENTIRYQMFFRGYPIYETSMLNIIEQQWRNNSLFQYSSPLFYITSSFEEENVQLDSGRDISYAIKSEYDLEKVQDIRVGYSIENIDSFSSLNSLKLVPSWYLKYNGYWQKISVEEINFNKGVS
ncbi:YycH family regulatory protein [Ornithinibacillus salinisoli]|uniref:YycH family regulatory protein n=1 Tax=Ornithinibacillus salinisoli TaxID=1848459 RepID=A0ABW4W1Y2_9BACI